jgi:oxalate decarboxylase/phosphoglucose isomerase-like protein (cupin superfamily)
MGSLEIFSALLRSRCSRIIRSGLRRSQPGCFIREHTHNRNEEIIFVVESKGSVKLDGEKEYPLEFGSAVYLGMNRKHMFINPGPGPMTFVWFFIPGGLDQFFAPGSPAI